MEAAAGGGCGSGPPLLLSEGEQQCYSELFARCAGAAGGGPGSGPPEAARTVPGTVTAAAGPVADLFRASQLPAETLHQITELCGAKRVGYFGPTQFYIALKLIAAAQSGLPVRIESIKCELPLPRFMMSKTDAEIRFGNPAELHGTKVQIPYLITEKNTFKRMDDEDKQQETQSPTMSPLASPPSSPPHYQRVPLSHGYSKLRSSTEQMHPAPYEARQPLVQPEGPSSGAPGAKPPRHKASLIRSFSVEREPHDNSSNYPDEPWRITEEQREYYVNQFRSLQPDPSSFISGSVAKNFFTKSKLSIPELSYIWELSDADCDGALTLPEFCAAFHLIVARKNGYPLPEGLPPTLQPEYLQAAFPKPKRECTLFDSYSESMPANQQPRDLNRMEKLSIKDTADFPVPTQDVTSDDKQEQNKTRLALKSTADEALPKDMSEDPATSKDSNSLKARPRSRSYSSTSIEEAMKRGEDPPTPPPRPQKTHSRASSLDLNKVFQPSVPATKSGLLPPPPALPPRPCPSQMSKPRHRELQEFPQGHPQQSEQVSEAEIHPQLNRAPSQVAESSPTKKDIPHSQPPSKPIRRKFRPENSATESQEPPSTVGPVSAASGKPHAAVQKQSSKQKKAIQTAIRKNKEANAVLARLNSELQQQLKEVHQERIALENQLEQLRPVTVL
ncbi:ralBP1-associated Eps domain-containing protein 2 isoform X6 [Canis lupus familiaris]|uniref:ralBP1-associated Eps domain-containing protein 2 isoform X6 n=1 Tax=Canis lupus familiaris TaxID=9615 RepID=UPI000BAA2441|nr:ralBP1-associated Eps domain-containing protein 2 isoform X6 [Canis lupus familiaris]XP_025293288.1 ralBP1-associated Eps domain-containing protein 2 isoform X6 [Canis lupus dingo]XP_038305415.1 ralBP1-associated Eps domain-containing protein 2 isoform X6 [Canis lupus familiaris]XP_038442839.1 ralBP1-associated Eps domain-containing protein 2 isoform X6 [Canis lupus familiaris]|eukprot:XP_022271269.1 ralBP1-associated Eps domain-containing protein 2 isoform X6 [Canis lupus familiaris]